MILQLSSHAAHGAGAEESLFKDSLDYQSIFQLICHVVINLTYSTQQKRQQEVSQYNVKLGEGGRLTCWSPPAAGSSSAAPGC